jgi:hypothetical protein
MSTSRPVKRCRRSNSGVSVVELVIVMVIMGLLAILVAAPLQMTNQLSKSSIDRLVDAADSSLSLRIFSQQFNGSQIARSPLLKCAGKSTAFKNESTTAALIELKPSVAGDATAVESQRFSLPYSSASSLGAMDESTTDGVKVSDVTMFKKGDLVVLANAEDSSVAGLFRVEEAEYEDSRIRLKDATIDDESDCTISTADNTSLADFKNMASTKNMRNVIVMRFHVATYQVDGDRIMIRIYPQTLAGSQTTMLAENFESFRASLRWQKRQDTGLAATPAESFEEIEGTMWATVDLIILEPDEATARQQLRCRPEDVENPSQVCQNGQLFNRRVIKNIFRYVMAGTKSLNPQVTTAAISKQNLFPTCYIKAEEVGYKLTVPPGVKGFKAPANSKLFQISGAVSEKGLAQITLTVGAKSRPGGSLTCINMAELKAMGDKNNPTSPGEVEVFGSSFALKGTPSALDEMLCSVVGGVEFTGFLRYYDPGAGKAASIACRESVGIEGGAGSVFDFQAGRRVSCSDNGICDIPSEIEEAGTGNLSIGKFYDHVNCDWSDGQERTCCDGTLLADTSLKLKKIEVTVTGIKMKDNNKLSAVCN